MKHYIIGDVQGCYRELENLLAKIQFDPHQHQLIFAGDLVNRGPQSLDVVRYLKSLNANVQTVLGNHDLFLIACAYGHLTPSNKDSIQDILQAQDKLEIIDWLRQQPFLIEVGQHVITHAGVPPNWSVKKAKKRALELSEVMQDDYHCQTFMAQLFGNKPNLWSKELKGIERWRCIANYFTRMRLCKASGKLDFNYKGKLNSLPKDYQPWFHFPRKPADNNYTFLFGHWSALQGLTNSDRFIALDTGCVWGGKLSACCIEDKTITQVNAYKTSKGENNGKNIGYTRP